MRTFEDLQRQVSEGRLSRREFVKRSTALGTESVSYTADVARQDVVGQRSGPMLA